MGPRPNPAFERTRRFSPSTWRVSVAARRLPWSVRPHRTRYASDSGNSVKTKRSRIFFRNLRAIDRKTFSPEPESFGYYLSAFVSAGRSVTLALQSEHKQEYDSWFPAWLESLTDEECALLEQFNTHRIATIHKQGIEVSYQWEEMSQSEFLLAAATEGVNIQMFRGPPGIAAIRSQRPVRTFAASGNESQVTETASGYLRLLQRMVVEFASHFANAA